MPATLGEVEFSSAVETALHHPYDQAAAKLDALFHRFITLIMISDPMQWLGHWEITDRSTQLSQMISACEGLGRAASSSSTFFDAIVEWAQSIRRRWPHLPEASRALANNAAELMGAGTPPELFGAIEHACETPDSEPTGETLVPLPRREWFTSAMTAARVAGLDPMVFRRFDERGLLTPLKETSAALPGALPGHFSLDEISRMADRVFAKAAPQPEAPPTLIRIKTFNVVEVVDLILQGSLSAFHSGGNGYLDLMVPYADSPVASKRFAPTEGYSTVTQAAARLEVTSLGVYEMLQHGMLRHRRLPGWRGRYLIEMSSLEEVAGEFLSARAAARAYGVKPVRIIGQLKALGIEKVPGLKLASLVRRAEVRGLRPTDVASARTARPFKKRERIRIENISDPAKRRLYFLVEKHGGVVGFTKASGWWTGAVTSILQGRQPFTPQKMRNLEKKLGLASGWMDAGVDGVCDTPVSPESRDEDAWVASG